MFTKLPSEEESIKPGLAAAPFAIFAGLAFVIPYIATAAFLGPEFPSLVGAFIGLPIVQLAAKSGFLVPKDSWDFPDKSKWEKDWKSVIEDKGDTGEAKISLQRPGLPTLKLPLTWL